jgi:hypothetical protein
MFRKCEGIWYRYLARCTFSDVDQLCTLQMFLRSTLHVCMLCFVLHVCAHVGCWLCNVCVHAVKNDRPNAKTLATCPNDGVQSERPQQYNKTYPFLFSVKRSTQHVSNTTNPLTTPTSPWSTNFATGSIDQAHLCDKPFPTRPTRQQDVRGGRKNSRG